jgi:hypothetical protein
VPANHPIYSSIFNFPNGLPKIHEHNNQPPQGLALFHEGRMVVFYTYETDLGDGWENADVHDLPSDLRASALRMGVNIIVYALTQ